VRANARPRNWCRPALCRGTTGPLVQPSSHMWDRPPRRCIPISPPSHPISIPTRPLPHPHSPPSLRPATHFFPLNPVFCSRPKSKHAYVWRCRQETPSSPTAVGGLHAIIEYEMEALGIAILMATQSSRRLCNRLSILLPHACSRAPCRRESVCVAAGHVPSHRPSLPQPTVSSAP
jgi:hypothetical protein